MQREDIENLQASTKSLMPDGFEKQVKPEEIRDLLEFLTTRGQVLPARLGQSGDGGKHQRNVQLRGF